MTFGDLDDYFFRQAAQLAREDTMIHDMNPAHDLDLERAREDCFKPTADRFQADLNRAREYIEAARPRVHVPQADGDACPSCGQLWDWHLDETGCRVGDPAYFDKWTEQPANLTNALFGEYTCRRCNSYQHKESDHRSQYGEAPPQ